MQIKPYHCIHCDAETQNYAIIHMIFDQFHYTHDQMFGQTYYDGSETVDAGEVPVFVCDDCIAALVNFGSRPGLNMVLAAIAILGSVLTLTHGSGMGLLIIPMFGAIGARIVIRGEFADRNNRRIDRTGVGSAGYSKDEQKRMANMFPDADSSFEESWLNCNAALIIVMLAGFILSFFLKGTLMKILAWVILVPAIISFIFNLLRCFSKGGSKGSFKEDTIKEAARYYLYQDEGIRLKFQ